MRSVPSGGASIARASIDPSLSFAAPSSTLALLG
jgi:hypothetical protein